MSGQAFTSTAAFYMLFSDSEARIDRERPLLTGLLETTSGHRVADIACGTGLHAAMFAEAGAYVDAFDLSPDMIEQARTSHHHERISYWTGDMRDLEGGPWDMIVCLGNSLSLLEDKSDLAQTFRAVSRNLSHGGCFITQTLNYCQPTARKPRQRIQMATLEGSNILAVKNLVPHGERTFLAITFFIDAGGRVTALTDTAVLRHLNIADFESAAVDTGLALDTVYGSYDRAAFDQDISTDLICVFKK